MDRVRHLTLKESEASFDSKLPKGEEIDYTDESSDSDTDPGPNPGTRDSPQGQRNDRAQDFSNYIDTPGNQDSQNAQEYELPGGTQAATQPRRQQEQPEPRLTRAGAIREGIYVEEFPLPKYCYASSRGRNKQN